MEFVFRAKSQDYGDLFIKANKDGSVKVTIQSRNETGQYNYTLSAEEFDALCKIREMSIANNAEK